MAVSFIYNTPNNYLWSIKNPMYLYWQKDSGTSDNNVELVLTQGTYTKTINLKYSGLILEFKNNIADLIKNYFQYVDLTTEEVPPTANKYAKSKTMKVEITITDDDNSITTSQYFVDNAGFNFANQEVGFGADNFSVYLPINNLFEGRNSNYSTPLDKDVTLTLPNQVHPPSASSTNDPATYFYLIVRVDRIPSTSGSVFNFQSGTLEEDRLYNINIPTTPDPFFGYIDGVKVRVEYYVDDGGGSVKLSEYELNYDFKEYCNTSKKETIRFIDKYGGIQYLHLANIVDDINKTEREFTLFGGEKIYLDKKFRKSGTLYSEYVIKDEAEFYESLFLSQSVVIQNDDYNDLRLIPINIVNKQFKEKEIDGTTMVQYVFKYEESVLLNY